MTDGGNVQPFTFGMKMHVPVLVAPVLEILSPKEGGIYVDATVGLGGHSERLLAMIGDSGTLVGIDRDDAALQSAKERLAGGRVVLERGRFSQIAEILRARGISDVDGILFDLGVSMLHFRDMERGFSFESEGRIDMRMDRRQELTGWDVVNTYSESRLETVLREYGEDPKAKAVARALVAARKRAPIDRCVDLARVVSTVHRRRGKTHPATRVFQAIRIEVNDEMRELSDGLRSAWSVLKRGGRLCVISYHSLEDRIVKTFMKERAKAGEMRILTKKPVMPDQQERGLNPSSRSARLRGAERI